MPDQFIFKIFFVILFTIIVDCEDIVKDYSEDKKAFLELIKKQLMQNNDDYIKYSPSSSKYDSSATINPNEHNENDVFDSRAQPLVMRQVSNKYNLDLSEFEDIDLHFIKSNEKHELQPLNKDIFPVGAKKYFQGGKIFIWKEGSRRKGDDNNKVPLIEPYVRPPNGVRVSTQSIYTIPVSDFITGSEFEKYNSKIKRRFYNLASKEENDMPSLYVRGSEENVHTTSKSKTRDKKRTRQEKFVRKNRKVFIGLDELPLKFRTSRPLTS